MKILHVLSSNAYSGAEKVAIEIIKQNKLHESIYLSPKGKIVEKTTEDKVNHCVIEKFKAKFLRKAIKKIKPDVIHAHDIRATLFCSLIRNNSKIISHIHGNDIKMRRFSIKSILFLFATIRVKKIIWVSKSSFDDYKFKRFVTNKSTVITNNIKINSFDDKSQDSHIKKYDLIYVGRLAYPKNPIRTVKIMEKLSKITPNFKGAIVGDGEDSGIIKDYIKKNALTDIIDLLGYVSEPIKIMKKSRLLILTSLYEGTPMVILEALSIGLPIISTPIDGALEIIENDYNGFLSNDDTLLVNKIIEYIEFGEKYQKMCEYAKTSFNRINNYDLYINKINKIYQEALM